MTINEFFTKLENGATWSAGVSFKRANPLPIDLYSVFSSYEALEDYATDNAVAYPGQIVAVTATDDSGEYTGAIEVYTLAQKENGEDEEGNKLYKLVPQAIGCTYSLSVSEDDEHTLILSDGVSDAEITLDFLTEAEVDAKISGLQDEIERKLEQHLAANDAMVFKGVIKSEEEVNAIFTDIKETAWSAGYTWKFAKPLTLKFSQYSGGTDLEGNPMGIGGTSEYEVKVETGDMLVAIADHPEEESNFTIIDDDNIYADEYSNFLNYFTIIQANTDGAVTGGTTSTVGNIAIFDNTTGTVIKDSGVTVHTHDNKSTLDKITETKVSNWDEAEKNVIADVDDDYFSVDETRKLTLLDIAMDKVTGLNDALDDKANKTDVYTKEETLDKIAEKITEINGGESAGEVLSQLNSYKETNDARVKTVEDSLLSKLEGVKIDGTLLEIAEDKTVNIKIASASVLGVVKGSDAENKVSVDADGIMEVNNLNVNKLVQTDGDTLILNGGNASLSTSA